SLTSSTQPTGPGNRGRSSTLGGWPSISAALGEAPELGVLRLDVQHHARGDAKDGVGGPVVDEAGRAGELHRVRVCRHLQVPDTLRAQDRSDTADEGRRNPVSHPGRIYEEVF